MKTTPLVLMTCLFFLSSSATSPAGDWSGFRGPDASGLSSEKNLPVEWSAEENLLWKTEIPGAGSSSPIVVGERVFVTCYSGYGVPGSGEGTMENLTRHLICFDLAGGSILWDREIESRLPEDPYRSFITEHGYASSTPASDGERVYVFFGKTGVLAFDLEGNQLWQQGVGSGSDPREWGSASSPLLHKEMVIINAAAESESLVALNKLTGEEVWKIPASGLEQSWSTPVLVTSPEGREEIVLNVPYEVWGLNPENGKLLWYAEAIEGDPINPTIVAGDGVVYATGGRRPQSTVAIRTGGKADVTETHVLWRAEEGSYVPSPVLYEGRLYLVNDGGQAYCLNAETGEVEGRQRLSGRFYASVVAGDGKLYAVSRGSGTFVLSADPELKQLARNTLGEDNSDFNASPAISDGRILLRSNRFLYCIGSK